ncbi:hypothetical protein AB0F92_31720 [Kitasatospora aureofaciens]|uniref:hypothetical protein n=1 Tax=Kitasatospora aureofaciens TaxID=1894 RepID=UPI0033CE4343
MLAYIDGDQDTLAAIVDRIGTWDDEPGRQPYPLPRYQHAAKTAMQLANTFFEVAAINSHHIANWAVADAQLVEQHAPTQHRQEAVARLAVLRRAGDAANFSDSDLDDEARFLAFTAAAAFLGMDRRVAASRETVRLKLIEHIRQDEAAALRVPARERITSISDEEALAFLDDLYGEGYPLPRDPQERAVWEQDILAVIKQHLLEIPAASTTPDQRRALHDRLITILQAAAGTPHRTPKPRPRDGVVRNQPKRTTKRKLSSQMRQFVAIWTVERVLSPSSVR